VKVSGFCPFSSNTILSGRNLSLLCPLEDSVCYIAYISAMWKDAFILCGKWDLNPQEEISY
jgi:hypothetical protein